MSNNKYDVIIVGAGFSGITASRELSQKGLNTLVLEGRDRIGGRTWYEERMGEKLELGGTYVHWNQPYMWAELTRYNLELKESPVMDKAYWLSKDGEVHSGTQEKMDEQLTKGMDTFLEDTKEYFPRPFSPFYENRLEKIDHLSILDKLKEIKSEVSDEVYSFLESTWSEYTNTDDLDVPALSQGYRWAALAGYDMREFQDTFEKFSIKNGTKALIEAIFNDSDAELKLSTTVTAIKKTNDGHTVVTENGEEYTADAVIAAIPINVLNNVEFTPPLSDEKQKIANEKQTSKGTKSWAKVRGLTGPITMKAPPEYPINSAHVEIIDGDEGYIMGFGSDEKKMDMNNPKEVEEMYRNFFPDIEVIDSTGHNWIDDKFSQGTWGVLKKNQLSKYGKELQKSENGLYLAGSDYANGWIGYMDGAIESGLSTSERVAKYLDK